MTRTITSGVLHPTILKFNEGFLDNADDSHRPDRQLLLLEKENVRPRRV